VPKGEQQIQTHAKRAKTTETENARNPELARVEADIERTRERVATSVMALRQEVARQTDWRQWVRRRPGAFLAGAFVVGFILGQRH
jgi:Flp pilus assembly protein TadD